MQSILTSSIFFYTLIINFILDLSKFRDDYDIDMSVTCKFFKRNTCVFDKFIWTTTQWNKTLINRLNIDDWDVLKTIIFDRDRKFMFDFWMTMFRILSVRLLFFTTYHSQTNDQSKRINQTLKIALRFVISLLNNFANWFDLMLKLQRVFNNNVVNINHTFNEIVYDFISTQSNLIFLQQFAKLIVVVDLRVAQRIVRTKINDVITLSQMYFKLKYDRKHQSLYMRVDDWTFLRLHKRYKISTTTRLEKKLSQ